MRCTRDALVSLLVAGFAISFLAACTSSRQYTSLDLALLPCEQGNSPLFFRPIEFDEDGAPVYKAQVAALLDRLRQAPAVTDLVFFVHGWNKNASSAELDYQNFLCRLHARLRMVIGESKRAGGLLVVGIFWPSTITNAAREPVLIKPISYYRVRDRADRIAEKGVAPLLRSLTLDVRAARGGLPTRLQLIGHSFGGRMLVRSLEILSERGDLVPLLQEAGEVNVVLLNAAVPPARFEWLSQAVTSAKRAGTPARFTGETNSYLFNVHSFNDSANRVLFPLASMFNDDPATCAAGACGVPRYATVCVDESAGLHPPLAREAPSVTEFNAWNVDATRVVFDHSDIYKGRVATLVADLVYGNEKTRWPKVPGAPDAGDRCRDSADTGGQLGRD